MGLCDNVYGIQATLISERAEKQKQKEQKEHLKSIKLRIKNILLDILIEFYKKNERIYYDDVKRLAINFTIENYLKNKSDEYLKRYQLKYSKDIKIYLNDIYYTICGKAEKIAKKQGFIQQKITLKDYTQEAEAPPTKKDKLCKLLKNAPPIIIQIFTSIFSILAIITKIVFAAICTIFIFIFSFFIGFVSGMSKSK